MTMPFDNCTKRKRGKDKTRSRFNLNGKYSTKYVRAKEKLLEKGKSNYIYKCPK
jgi:hypothetical protein